MKTLYGGYLGDEWIGIASHIALRIIPADPPLLWLTLSVPKDECGRMMEPKDAFLTVEGAGELVEVLQGSIAAAKSL